MKDGLAFYCRPCTQQIQRDNYRKRLERKKLKNSWDDNVGNAGRVQLTAAIWDRWQRDLASIQPKTRGSAELDMRQARRRPHSAPALTFAAIIAGIEPDEVASAMFSRMIHRQKSADKERIERKGSPTSPKDKEEAQVA